MSDDTPDRVIRATELVGRPVVTLGGDDLAEVRDVVYDADQGALLGFTLTSAGGSAVGSTNGYRSLPCTPSAATR